MSKITFSILSVTMLMSFAAFESETARKVPITKQINSVKQASCSYVVSGEPVEHSANQPLATITLSTGRVIPVTESFSLPILVSSPSVIATIQSNGFRIRVNGAPVVCQDGTTSIEFYNTCYFTGGNCGDQP